MGPKGKEEQVTQRYRRRDAQTEEAARAKTLRQEHSSGVFWIKQGQCVGANELERQ